MTNQTDKTLGCVVGALLADAAALGLHWIYDPVRIAEVANAHGSAAFVPPAAENYEGVPSYFAHGLRRNGQLSPYGESLLLAVYNLVEHQGTLNGSAYQQAYLTHFGMGGTYQGYIDRPTRATLENIIAEQVSPSGTEDDQLPALTRLVPLVAITENLDSATDELRAAIEITNLGTDAINYGKAFARLLHSVLKGETIGAALAKTADETDQPDIADKLTAALKTTETDSVRYGETTQRACHLSQGLPLSFHILHHAKSYREAIELNIRAGGDSCGRALIIGSVYGALVGGQNLPIDWLLQMDNGHHIWTQCERLASVSI